MLGEWVLLSQKVGKKSEQEDGDGDCANKNTDSIVSSHDCWRSSAIVSTGDHPMLNGLIVRMRLCLIRMTEISKDWTEQLRLQIKCCKRNVEKLITCIKCVRESQGKESRSPYAPSTIFNMETLESR